MGGSDIDFIVSKMLLPVQSSLENLIAERGELLRRLQITIDLNDELRSGLSDLLILIVEESETMREGIEREERRDGKSRLCRIE